MANGLTPEERLAAAASALGMRLEEIRSSGSATHIMSGHDHLKQDQALALVAQFRRLENPKTRSMLIGLVKSLAEAERSI